MSIIYKSKIIIKDLIWSNSFPLSRVRYGRAVYEAAALAVRAVLRRLAEEGFYRELELQDALCMAAKAVVELPNSMVGPGLRRA